MIKWYKTYVYRIIEYKKNIHQHRFWLYPEAKGKIISVTDGTQEPIDLDTWTFFFYGDETKHKVWDVLNFQWSRDYGFWLSAKDYYVRYIFPESAIESTDWSRIVFTLPEHND